MRRVPVGLPSPDDFEMIAEPLPLPARGEMLLRTRWLSLDPYMRSGFMTSIDNVGKTVIGGTVSEVVESRARGWQRGDMVVGYTGWQEFSIAKRDDLQWNNPGMPIQKWDGSLVY